MIKRFWIPARDHAAPPVGGAHPTLPMNERLGDSACVGRDVRTGSNRPAPDLRFSPRPLLVGCVDVHDNVDRDGLRAEQPQAGRLGLLATMHDLSAAGGYADRMVLLADGRVVAAAPPREVLTENLLAEHYRASVRVVDGDHGRW